MSCKIILIWAGVVRHIIGTEASVDVVVVVIGVVVVVGDDTDDRDEAVADLVEDEREAAPYSGGDFGCSDDDEDEASTNLDDFRWFEGTTEASSMATADATTPFTIRGGSSTCDDTELRKRGGRREGRWVDRGY